MIETFSTDLPHGITLSCRAAGQRGRPLMLFLHGFPEGAFIWDTLMQHFAQPQHNGLRAGSACALAARRLEAGETPLDYITLLPLYLRAPQAERERAAREGAKHG